MNENNEIAREQSHVLSAVLTILGSVDPEIRRLLCEQSRLSEAQVRRNVTQLARRLVEIARYHDVSIPKFLRPEERHALQCAMLVASREQRTIAEVLPALIEQVNATIPELERARTVVQGRIHRLMADIDVVDRRRHLRATAEPSEERLKTKRWLQRLAAGAVFLLELVTVLGTTAMNSGIFDYGFAAVSGAALFELLVFGSATALTAFLLAFAALRKLKVTGLLDGFPRFFALATTGAAVGYFAALAIARWIAVLPVSALTPEILLLENIVFAITVLASTLVAAVAFEFFLGKAADLGERIDEIRQNVATYQMERGRLVSFEAEERRNLASAIEGLGRPSELTTAFERGTLVLGEALASEDRQVDEKVEAAMSVWQRLQSLSPEELEHIHVLLFRVVHEPGESEGAASAPYASLVSTSQFLPLAMALALPILGACSAPVLHNEMEICDPTGTRPACTSEFLTSEHHSFAARNGGRPGAWILTLMTAGSHGEVDVLPAVVMPSSVDGNPRYAKAALARDTARIGGSYELIVDTENNRRVNRSDIISTLVVAASEARYRSCGQVDLVVASDGRQIGLGLNFEREIPSVELVRETLLSQGVVLDFSCFASVSFCGVHNLGVSAGDGTALSELWTELVFGGGGRVTSFSSECDISYTPLTTVVVAPNVRQQEG